MGAISKPHDRYFKYVLERPGAAEALLRQWLPPEFHDLAASSHWEPFDAQFVDAHLRGTRGDRIYLARQRPGAPARMYCLIEHKARASPNLARQLCLYSTGIWSRVLERRRAAGEEAPAVTALVVYNGRARWRLPTSFRELVGMPSSYGRYVMDFDFPVVDLGRISDDELSKHPALRAGLPALKYGTRRPKQLGVLMKIIEAMAAVGSAEFLEAGLNYLQEVCKSDEEALVRRALERVMPRMGGMMGTIAEKYLEAGIEKGIAEVLLAQLSKRFGPVPASRRSQVLEASKRELDRWVVRVLDAPDIDAVFESGP